MNAEVENFSRGTRPAVFDQEASFPPLAPSIDRKASSLLAAVRELRSEVKELIRQEVELAKTELAEKMRLLKRNATRLAIGGLVAYAAVIVMLFGLSGLAAAGLQRLGLSQLLASALGHVAIGLIVGIIGYGLISKATKVLSHETLTPEKTLETLGRNPDDHKANGKIQEPAALRMSSGEIKTSIDRTQRRLSELVGEVTTRMSPRYIFRTALPAQVKMHPVWAAIIGAGTGAAGFFLIKRRFTRRPNCD